jgi:hypothetical protein
MVRLPTERTEIDRQWRNQKLLIAGQGGIGKSTLLASDPFALFLNTDHNLTHLQILDIPIWNWEDFREAYVLLAELAAKKEPFPYSTIVVDTVDKLLEYADENVIQRAREKFKRIHDEKGIYVLSDIPEGAGWANSTKTFLQGLDKLAALPAGLVLISHTRTVKVEEPLQKYDKEGISLWGQIATKTVYFVNHVLQVQAFHAGDKLIRKIYTLPRKNMDAKSHGAMIKDGWEMVDEMKQNWLAIRNIFEPHVDENGFPVVAKDEKTQKVNA